jgi:hypothetical protein
MGALLDKMAARRTEKSFVQPPFWTQDGLTDASASAFWSPMTGAHERIEPNYSSFIESAYKASPPVFAVIGFRQAVLSEARFQWRQFVKGRPGELFGSSELSLLENPWPGGTTGNLLTRMEVTASLAGNYYGTTADDRGRLGRAASGPSRRIVHMRPDWVTIVIDSQSGDPNALDARIVGYIYKPPPPGSGIRDSEPVTLLPEEVCHFAPITDPGARFRGMSWLTPLVEEVRADKAATLHKARFFQNGAVPNMAVVLGSDVGPTEFTEYVAAFKAAHAGADNAWKTLFLAGGADVRPLAQSFSDMDFKPLQGLAETRVASAAGVHPTVVGFSEGLSGSSLNSGNFNAAARLVANRTLRPWWRDAAASLSTLVTAPAGGAQLWYDDRDIAFLREDATDQAQIQQTNASALGALLMAGFKPDAAVAYLQSGDLGRLVGNHSGLYSVQLLPAGTQTGSAGQASPTEESPPVPRA